MFWHNSRIVIRTICINSRWLKDCKIEALLIRSVCRADSEMRDSIKNLLILKVDEELVNDLLSKGNGRGVEGNVTPCLIKWSLYANSL